MLAFGRDLAQNAAEKMVAEEMVTKDVVVEEMVLVDQSVEARDLVRRDEAHAKRLAMLEALGTHPTACSTLGCPPVSTLVIVQRTSVANVRGPVVHSRPWEQDPMVHLPPRALYCTNVAPGSLGDGWDGNVESEALFRGLFSEWGRGGSNSRRAD